MSEARSASTESVNQATTPHVFMSIGRTWTPKQAQFVEELVQYLRDQNLTPRALNRTDFSSSRPLDKVAEIMEQCSGTVIIAFERRHIEKAVEMRGSEHPKEIENANLPTVWNQIEASQAYTLGQPLLVIAEHGLYSEGLLEEKYDWFVQWVDIDRSTLYKRDFSGVVADWRNRVEAFATAKHAARDEATIEPNTEP